MTGGGILSDEAADPHNLQRFLDAQAPIYRQVLAELRAGRKETHWMWFIFPQIRGLGSSLTAERYAVHSIEEAKAYLDHQVLGPRLCECTQLVNAINGRTIEEIFWFPDNLKFHSCMTLFLQASANERIFATALDKYFNSGKDRETDGSLW